MFGSPLGADDGMSCGQPTDTLYGTVTTTSTGELATITSQSLSTAVISGTFLSDLCASTAAGACVASTPQVLSFTYTSKHLLSRFMYFVVLTSEPLAVATNQVVVTTRPIITTTQAVPTSTFAASCVVSETTLANGSVSNVYITVTGDTAASTSGGGGGGGSSSNGAIIGGVVGGIVVVAALIIVIWVLWRRNRQMSRQIKANEEEEKRNTIINVEELFPSPFIQVFPSSDLLSRVTPLLPPSLASADATGTPGIFIVGHRCPQRKYSLTDVHRLSTESCLANVWGPDIQPTR